MAVDNCLSSCGSATGKGGPLCSDRRGGYLESSRPSRVDDVDGCGWWCIQRMPLRGCVLGWWVSGELRIQRSSVGVSSVTTRWGVQPSIARGGASSRIRTPLDWYE